MPFSDSDWKSIEEIDTQFANNREMSSNRGLEIEESSVLRQQIVSQNTEVKRM